MESLNDAIYITCPDERSYLTKTEGGIYLPTEQRKYEKDMVVQWGYVYSAPKSTRKGDCPLKEGDKVYTHHFLQDEDNVTDLGKQQVFLMDIDQIYCRITDEGIEMVHGWIFVQPIHETEEDIDYNGIKIRTAPQRLPSIGRVTHTNHTLEAQGVKKDDTVAFKTNREYEIIVEGDTYFRMRDTDILAKLQKQ